MDLEKMDKDYKDFSSVANQRALQLAWAFILMEAAGLMAGHVFRIFSICAMLAAIFMMLSVLQALWQTVSFWIFKQQVYRERSKYPELTDAEYEWPEDYPNWIGFGAWVFFLAKMAVILAAVVYFTKAIFF